MRVSELNQLIESPERLQKEQINDLQDLISEYPYFTSAQLLLTKAFFDSENLNFEKQLRLSAAYSGDRKKLHDLIYSGREILDEASESADLQSTEVKNEEDISEEKDGLGHRFLSEAEGRQSASESSQSELDPQAQADQDFLDAQIMSAAIGNSIVEELETGVQSTDSKSTDLQSEDSQSADLQSKEAFEKPEVRSQKPDTLEEEDGLGHRFLSEAEGRPSAIESSAFDEQQPHSFSEWLKHYSSDSDQAAGLDPQTSDAKAGEASARIKSISDQAKQIQEKAEFYSAAKMAKLSVTESDDLVTETLAKVFEDQGKYEKAIKAYEKLRLKFPEKSVYFAGRIKAVEKKLKS